MNWFGVQEVHSQGQNRARFNREHLKSFWEYGKKTPLEFQEDIEIDRFIEMGYKVKMVMVDNVSHAVDYPEDIEIVEKMLS